MAHKGLADIRRTRSTEARLPERERLMENVLCIDKAKVFAVKTAGMLANHEQFASGTGPLKENLGRALPVLSAGNAWPRELPLQKNRPCASLFSCSWGRQPAFLIISPIAGFKPGCTCKRS